MCPAASPADHFPVVNHRWVGQQRSGIGVNDVTQQNGWDRRTSESGFGAKAINIRAAAKPSAVALLQFLSIAYVLGSHRRGLSRL
jgi:hypothetical protein